jgi:hypothetical protein
VDSVRHVPAGPFARFSHVEHHGIIGQVGHGNLWHAHRSILTRFAPGIIVVSDQLVGGCS